MYKTSARLVLVLGLTSALISPSYARGFGGFNRGGGGFSRAGGGFDRGGFDRGGSFGRNNLDGGFGGHETHPNFGGGFSSAGGNKPIVSNHPNYGVGEGSHAGQFPNHSQFPTDGGFGNTYNHANVYQHNNDFNRNVNVNANGYHPYNGYHAYNGYHPYGAYGYHGYGYGYNPTAAMWTYAGVSSLTTLTAFLGMSMLSSGKSSKQPASYSNVTYNNGDVYIDGQTAGSSADFYQQAQKLAASAYAAGVSSNNPAATSGAISNGAVEAGVVSGGALSAGALPGGADAAASTSGDAQWQSLGTFSLAQKGQTQSTMMLQMQINKDGILHGTYYNQLTMETQEIYGALDKATQRISWTIGSNPSTVFDAGLGDLLKEESSVLVHYGPSNTQRMALIRLKKAPEGMPEPGQGATQSQT